MVIDRDGWRHTTLGDLISLQRGHDLPERLRHPGLVPVIGSGGHTGWHDETIVCGPGITIGRAANLGVPNLIQDDFWPLNTTLYVTDFHGNDVHFIYYLFKFLDLTGFDSGSVQPMLNRNYVRKFPVVVPDPAKQQAIAGTLGALDDKIALNERISGRCEELATALFDAEELPFFVELYVFGDRVDGRAECPASDGSRCRVRGSVWGL
jgi:type I restriction enzyme, S subunit